MFNTVTHSHDDITLLLLFLFLRFFFVLSVSPMYAFAADEYLHSISYRYKGFSSVFLSVYVKTQSLTFFFHIILYRYTRFASMSVPVYVDIVLHCLIFYSFVIQGSLLCPYLFKLILFYTDFLFIRSILYCYIGFASMSVPVYVAEVAPAHIRGALVTLNQLFITIGIVISSVIAGAFSENKENGWR